MQTPQRSCTFVTYDLSQHISYQEQARTVAHKKENLFRAFGKSEYPLYILSLTVFFALWQWVGQHATIHGDAAIATSLQVLNSLYELSTSFHLAGLSLPEHILASTQRVAIGFAISVVIGIPVGLALAYSPIFRALFNPIFCILKPMPPLAWISVAILWMGIGEAPKVFIIVLGSVIPIILNAYNSLILIDEEMYDVVKVLGGSRWDRIRMVSFPAALPCIAAGLQIAMSVAWGSVVAAEMVSSRSGLGFLIMQGMKISDSGMIISGMIIIALMALLFSQGIVLMFRIACPWQRHIANT